jgi:UPF0755 protein
LLLSQEQLFRQIENQSTHVLFTIESGDSLDTILEQLTELGLVNNKQAFRAYLIYAGIDTRIQPGDYQISSGLFEIEVANQLGDPQSTQTTITILPGWRAEEIAESFAQAGLDLSKEEFLDVVNLNQKEGYLFPDSYQVMRDIQANELIDLMFSNFITQISTDYESQIEEQGLSLQQAVILASIIEKEAVLKEEMPLIASVFLNRIGIDMKLGADPTVQYALGYNGDQASWWTNPLSLEDLKVSSPYNTYEYPGLPPGPICNPSYEALQAVAKPVNTNFFYFRAACDGSGSHLFAETFDEHLENECP